VITQAIIARIKAQCPGFVTVDHALTSAADMAQPAALVTPVQSVAGEPRLVGLHSQRERTIYGVYVLIERRQDGIAGGALADLDALRAELRDALKGWTPDPAIHTELELAGGQLEPYRSGIVAWRENFASETEHRKV
jgi:hypothetical protein